MFACADISENWSPDATGSVLPPNIVPSLRKVMTPDGYLTFERFCAGLKICILRHSAQRHRQADNDSSNDTEDPRYGLYFYPHSLLLNIRIIFKKYLILK